MAKFQLEKGGRFQIDKGVRRVRIGLGWDAGDNFDLDGSAFGLVKLPSGKPMFYGDGSHAVCYANTELKRPDGTFATVDGSIVHSGDNRTGAGTGDDEVITVDLDKLPADVVEVAVWVTIYKAHERRQSFGLVKNSYIKISDVDANADLAEYKLREEFSDSTSVQVGSLVRDGRTWTFAAVGSGAGVELGQVLEQYS